MKIPQFCRKPEFHLKVIALVSRIIICFVLIDNNRFQILLIIVTIYRIKFVIFPGFLDHRALFDVAIGGAIMGLILLLILIIANTKRELVTVLILFIYGAFCFIAGIIIMMNIYIYTLRRYHGEDVYIISMLPFFAGIIMLVDLFLDMKFYNKIKKCYTKRRCSSCCKRSIESVESDPTQSEATNSHK